MANYVDAHYSELASKFTEPASRTRERLRPVLAATIQALIAAKLAGDALFASKNEDIFGGGGVEASWRADMLATLKRLAKYSAEIVPPGTEPGDLTEWGSLDPQGLAPETWAGLIERRSLDNPDGLGAGAVPDAAMPAHLADQIGILDAHVAELGKSWFVGTLAAIPDWLADKAEDIADKAKDVVTAGYDWIGKLLGAAAFVALLVVAAKSKRRGDR